MPFWPYLGSNLMLNRLTFFLRIRKIRRSHEDCDLREKRRDLNLHTFVTQPTYVPALVNGETCLRMFPTYTEITFLRRDLFQGFPCFACSRTSQSLTWLLRHDNSWVQGVEKERVVPQTSLHVLHVYGNDHTYSVIYAIWILA